MIFLMHLELYYFSINPTSAFPVLEEEGSLEVVGVTADGGFVSTGIFKCLTVTFTSPSHNKQSKSETD